MEGKPTTPARTHEGTCYACGHARSSHENGACEAYCPCPAYQDHRDEAWLRVNWAGRQVQAGRES